MLWGAWHGTFLVIERIGLSRLLLEVPMPARWAYTQLVVMGGWVLFRSNDLSMAGVMYGGLIGRYGMDAMGFEMHSALLPGAVMALLAGCAFAVFPRWIKLRSTTGPLLAIADCAWVFCLLLLGIVYVAAGVYSPFLYFRF